MEWELPVHTQAGRWWWAPCSGLMREASASSGAGSSLGPTWHPSDLHRRRWSDRSSRSRSHVSWRVSGAVVRC